MSGCGLDTGTERSTAPGISHPTDSHWNGTPSHTRRGSHIRQTHTGTTHYHTGANMGTDSHWNGTLSHRSQHGTDSHWNGTLSHRSQHGYRLTLERHTGANMATDSHWNGTLSHRSQHGYRLTLQRHTITQEPTWVMRRQRRPVRGECYDGMRLAGNMPEVPEGAQ